MNLRKKQFLSISALMLTVLVWGAGFVFTQILVNAKMPPSLINSIRFAVAVVVVGTMFAKKIKLTKNVLILGAIGGGLIFVAFMMQLSALLYTTPAYNGFFTAGYILFVPVILWVIFKRRPSFFVIIGTIVAIIGFFVLNFGESLDADSTVTGTEMMFGNLLTISSALFFGIQIVLSDYALHKKKADALSFTFFQLSVAAVLFIVYFFIVDFSAEAIVQIDWNSAILPLCVISLLGTAFAYPVQTNAQLYIPPAETSLILSAEALIAAVLSVIVGFDQFSWHILVGGILVTAAILTVEVVPEFLARRSLKKK